MSLNQKGPGVKRIVFRVDSSLQIGTGHVMRCVALAEALRSRGAEIYFFCRDVSGHLGELLKARRFSVTLFTTAPESESPGGPLNQLADAREVIGFITQHARPVDWLIVDHYSLDHIWERELAAHVDSVMVIDDLADRAHECAVLLDQNFYADPGARYANLIPEKCLRLLGPGFALLREEFLNARQEILPRRGPIQNIFVFFGGVDSTHETQKALLAIERLVVEGGETGLKVQVVLGAKHADIGGIRAWAGSRPWVTVHVQAPYLAILMKQSELAIGAGGTTTWERLCLGLPTIVVAVATNQEETSASLGQSGYLYYMGPHHQVTPERMGDEILARLRKPEEAYACGLKGMDLVDGWGALRVVEILLNPIRLRSVTHQDAELLLRWRNDPVSRESSSTYQVVTMEEHLRWLKQRLARSDCKLWIAHYAGMVIGTIRAERGDSGWEMSWNLAPESRGQGLGKWMLKAAVQLVEGRIAARIKTGNLASISVAKWVGFEMDHEADGVTHWILKTPLPKATL